MKENVKQEIGRGGVKMAVWEDAEVGFPHNQGACWPRLGDSDTQGDGRNTSRT